MTKELTYNDCKLCFASKVKNCIVDVINPLTNLSWHFGESLDQVKERYSDAEIMDIDDFCNWKAEQQRTPITLIKTTKEKYKDMLEVLPPISWQNGAFLVGEPYDHDAGNGLPRYEAFYKKGNKYYVSSRPITKPEFLETISC